MAKYVRLKPYNPAAGHVRQRYLRAGRLYDVKKGWYRVDEDVAADLQTVTQHDYDKSLRPIPAFDICTEEERRKIDKREQREQYDKLLKERGLPLMLGEMPVNDLTTAHLAGEESLPKANARAKR
jgi:hypothetical protein